MVGTDIISLKHFAWHLTQFAVSHVTKNANRLSYSVFPLKKTKKQFTLTDVKRHTGVKIN